MLPSVGLTQYLTNSLSVLFNFKIPARTFFVEIERVGRFIYIGEVSPLQSAVSNNQHNIRMNVVMLSMLTVVMLHCCYADHHYVNTIYLHAEYCYAENAHYCCADNAY